MTSKTHLMIFLLVLFAFAIMTGDSQAQVSVIRGAPENPAVVIAKSTLYGALTGLVVGAALTLVVDEDAGEIMKWSFVGGTFGGLALGIIHVATRPQPSTAMLQFNSGGLARITIPQPQVKLHRSDYRVQVPVASFSL